MDLKQLLLSQGPKIALAAIAARQGGPGNVAALLGGIQQAEMRKQQLARQQQMDAQAQEQAAFNRQNVERDNTRLDQNADMDRKQRAIALILQRAAAEAETATDPAMAQQALQQTAQSAGGMFGVDPSQLMGVAPDLAPVISKRKQKQALERYEALKKIYGEEAVASDAITDNGELFKGMKPSQILAMAQMGATDASGQAAAPYVKPTAANQPPATGSFEDFVLRKFGQNPTAEQILSARKVYQQVDDRPPVGAQPNEFKDIITLRTQLRSEPEFATVIQSRNGFQSVKVGAGLNNAQGDLAIVNGMAKLLDPMGVVLPAEFRTVGEAQGVLQRMMNYPKQIAQGDRLAPEARRDFLAAAEKLYREKRQPFRALINEVYAPLAQRHGINISELVPADYLRDDALGESPAPTPAPTATQAAPKKYEILSVK